MLGINSLDSKIKKSNQKEKFSENFILPEKSMKKSKGKTN